MSGIQMILMAGSAFVPVTNTYSTGSAATETVPGGATQCVIEIAGGSGGSGRANGGLFSGGGGSGGYSSRTVSVTGGQTFTYTVGAAGVGRTGSTGSGTAGGNTTVSSAAPSVSMTANGGAGGNTDDTTNSAAGGSASGGTVNTTGNTSTSITGASVPTYSPTLKGGNGTAGTANGNDGDAGRVRFAYT